MEITLLYASLLTILAIFLAIKVGMNRVETKTMTGEGESSKLASINSCSWKPD